MWMSSVEARIVQVPSGLPDTRSKMVPEPGRKPPK
jgi:hypothetical protein